MPEEKEFQERIQAIEGLIHKLEEMPDRSLWSAVRELLQSVMDLHGVALDRLLTILADHEGQAVLQMEALGRDELVGSVLLLHGLHPVDFETRTRHALGKTESILRGYGARAELLDTLDGNIRIQIHGVTSAHVAKSSRAAVEEAIYQAAPDAASCAILGLEQFAVDFVPLDQLRMAATGMNGHHSAHAGKGGI
jgi:hypothetical protein